MSCQGVGRVAAGAIHRRARLAAAVCLVLSGAGAGSAAPAAPVLDTVFPAGAAAGTSASLTISGSNLQGVRALRCSVPGARCEPLPEGRFRLSIPGSTPPGQYDLWAAGDNGISSPRAFSVGNRTELLEAEPNEAASTAQPVPLNVVINGRIQQPGDVDHFRFQARRGQRVVVECWAERIDSRLRAVPEIFDARGRRLAVSHGYFGVDPLIDFRVPADGAYVVRLQDVISSGSAGHYYRLEIDTGPRVAFTVPSVVQRGKATRVTLYGWNLHPRIPQPHTPTLPHPPTAGLDHVEVEIPAAMAREAWPLPVRLQPAQVALAAFGYHFPGSQASVAIGVTDVPVAQDRPGNHSPGSAQLLAYPCEVSGQLAAGGERDWYAIQARRGEVLYLEGLGERIQSPVDLQLDVLDPAGARELARFGDETANLGGGAVPTHHLDPSGRWVAPADGRYLVVVRSLIGGPQPDPRRVYRLSVRREEPDFQLLLVPRSDAPAGLALRRGGSEAFDVLAFRRRGMNGPIRVSARDLPGGIECPDVWLGPGVDRATVVVRADRTAAALPGELKLVGFAEGVGTRPARAGAVVRTGLPNGWGRLVSGVPLAVTGDAPLSIAADGHAPFDHHLYGTLQPYHSPGGILDVAVRVDRPGAAAPVTLTAIGLPETIANQRAILPAGEPTGYLSFYLPPTLPVGWYSLVVRAETTVPGPDKKPETTVVYSSPVNFEVRPAAFLLEVDPSVPTRVKRGETIQIRYAAQRRNGFIGKIHTELAAPGVITEVAGLRARGETFVGQTGTGALQIIINPDAPLGRYPFLRLFSVGVVEDEPVFQGGSFLTLEVVE